MSKYQQIFKAMSEGAELEVSTALGVWAKADYATVCELIGYNTVFSCRTPISQSKHSAAFPHPISREEYVKNNEDTVYYCPDTINLEVRNVALSRIDRIRLDKLLAANLLYLSEEDAAERLRAMQAVSRCVGYIVLYNGHATK